MKEISEGVLFRWASFCHDKIKRKGLRHMISDETKEYYDLKKRNDVRESALKKLEEQEKSIPPS